MNLTLYMFKWIYVRLRLWNSYLYSEKVIG